MKRIITSAFAVAILFAGTGFKAGSPQVKVYIKNNCSTDFKIYVTQSGGGGTYTIDYNSTKTMTIEAGQKIYDGPKNKLFHEVTTASEGKTIVVCG
ncbi:MAG TPA: hypothetical protein VD905_09425 [Flavobacteriales bacterium]|nr:hypothetical protein [Flavobacteriales bacterium]